MRAATVALALALLAAAYGAVQLRHRWLTEVTTADAVPGKPVTLPFANGPGLPATARTRVVLIDGLSATVAHDLPQWSALCERGERLVVDVGFPTISLPVEVALWSGLTQQQSGVVGHGDRAIVPPIHGIPSQVTDSRAIAEDHGYIVQSLGFARTQAEGSWQDDARLAVAGASPLVFVHVLRVDTAGHHFGADSDEYRSAAHEADTIAGSMIASAPDARWVLLADHGHLPGGGHGGEERAIRQVEACIAGPGVARGTGGPIHITDVARAIADSTGTQLDPASPGRPFQAALAAPLTGDQAVPAMSLAAGAIALLAIALGLVASSFTVKRWWLAPWWFVAACGLVFAIRGEPTLSTPMTYARYGATMFVCWLPALPMAAATAYQGKRFHVVAAQLALPIACLAAAISAAGGWPTVIGENVAPVVPHYTAWVSPLALMVAHGLAAVALGLLATLVPRASDRREPRETKRSET